MELIYEVNNLGLLLLTPCLMYAMLCQCFCNYMWICTVSGWSLRRSHQYYHTLFIRSWFVAKYLRLILYESPHITTAKLCFICPIDISYPQSQMGLLNSGITVLRLWFSSCGNYGNVFLYQNFTVYPQLQQCNLSNCRSQWPRGLRRRSTAARLLRLWVLIPPGAWIFVCCECCVLSGRGLCDGLIIRSEESYRLWCVVVCDQETS